MITLTIPKEYWAVIRHILKLHCFSINGDSIYDAEILDDHPLIVQDALERRKYGLQPDQRESQQAVDPERDSKG